MQFVTKCLLSFRDVALVTFGIDKRIRAAIFQATKLGFHTVIVPMRAQEYVAGQIDLGRESTDSQMKWIGEQWLGYGSILRPDMIKRRLARVTAS